MIMVNCDIGERGADHPVDIELMNYIQMANIACGGHAGDEESVAAFRKLSKEKNVKIAAHLSYPDKENFGRSTIEISDADLLKSLTQQHSMMSDVKCVKFHGALYNDCGVDNRLAKMLADWSKKAGITEMVTPFDSELAEECKKLGIKIIPEAFAERNYAYDPVSKRLTLVPRKKSYASIHELDDAVAHAEKIVKTGKVTGHIEKADGSIEKVDVAIDAQTICIHSDSVIALQLAKKLSEVLN